MIRPGEIGDRTRAVTLLRDSHQAAGFAGAGGFVFPFDCAYAARLYAAHLDQVNACCLVLDVAGVAQGVLLAIACEHPFGPVWLARETVWWIDPAHRGRSAIAMLDAYEAWAASRRCAFAGMAGMGDDPDVAKLYLRRGYFAAERHFLKGL
ncbi:GCN5 family acetyltransferase [Bradyrhizobium barranii subsp. barranii]|uniref:GCN5 family acetyltransferase n=1 Tax=Bradyrhizobium barranii subsp. barranii TaxID=2823807 RepID=A0A7Z0TUW1_9BRAD|nr:GCN5 family acetyltransferase [Bradyrhizobium barranii]UGX98226.1 GCN5 family acetyltransferase [Bradyrhizobium barranii subsp. barranii]